MCGMPVLAGMPVFRSRAWPHTSVVNNDVRLHGSNKLFTTCIKELFLLSFMFSVVIGLTDLLFHLSP